MRLAIRFMNTAFWMEPGLASVARCAQHESRGLRLMSRYRSARTVRFEITALPEREEHIGKRKSGLRR